MTITVQQERVNGHGERLAIYKAVIEEAKEKGNLDDDPEALKKVLSECKKRYLKTQNHLGPKNETYGN